MKKIYVFLIVYAAMALLPAVSNAQISTYISLKQAVAPQFIPYYGNITRAMWPSYRAITYVRDASTQRFVAHYNSTNYFYFDTPDDIRVLDFMQIPGSETFVFCGGIPNPNFTTVNVDDYHAVVGWFKMEQNEIVFWYLEIDTLYAFTKLDATICQSKEHFYAIGEKRFATAGGFRQEYYIFHTDDLQYPPSSGSMCNCQIMKVDKNETLYDVVCTDDYVAFIGYDRKNRSFCIRRDMHVFFPDPSTLQDLFLYPLPKGEPDITSMATALRHKLTEYSENDIAVCHKIKINDTTYSIRIRMFDISTMNMFNSQEIPIVGKMDPLEMTFLTNDSILALLVTENYFPIASSTPVLYIKPYLTSVYIADYFDPGEDYSSIDNVIRTSSDVEHFVLGETKYDKVLWCLNKATSIVQDSCRDFGQIEVGNIDNYNYQEIARPIYNKSSVEIKRQFSQYSIFYSTFNRCQIITR